MIRTSYIIMASKLRLGLRRLSRGKHFDVFFSFFLYFLFVRSALEPYVVEEASQLSRLNLDTIFISSHTRSSVVRTVVHPRSTLNFASVPIGGATTER